MRVMMTSMFVCLALAGCGADPDRSNQTTVARDTETTAPAAESSPASTPASTRAPTKVALTSGPSSKPVASTPISSELLSCNAEIGEAAAAKRVAMCRDVSPATHPPCNAVNSCAIIEDEIARSCALFDGRGTPIAGCEPAPKSMEAAAAVVRRYYSAINARDYATAWTQWGDEGRPGQTLAAFEAGFAHTRSTRVTIGALQPGDGGAGSIYQPVPVTVDATLDDGTQQRFRGTYVVRRVNDVDGASASQLRWHIGSAQLKRIPAA